MKKVIEHKVAVHTCLLFYVIRQNNHKLVRPSICGECWYLTDAMAFRRLEWHVRAEEATMAF